MRGVERQHNTKIVRVNVQRERYYGANSRSEKFWSLKINRVTVVTQKFKDMKVEGSKDELQIKGNAKYREKR